MTRHEQFLKLFLRIIGAAVIFFGLTLLVVDFVERLPLYWSLFEGPLNAAFGVLIFVCSRRLKDTSNWGRAV